MNISYGLHVVFISQLMANSVPGYPVSLHMGVSGCEVVRDYFSLACKSHYREHAHGRAVNSR